MASDSYQRQLANPEWQKKRLLIFERDNFKCCKCGNTEQELHVHHKWYGKNTKAWDYEDRHLETLCHDCHLEEEENLKENIAILIDYLKYLGADSDVFHEIFSFFSSYDEGQFRMTMVLLQSIRDINYEYETSFTNFILDKITEFKEHATERDLSWIFEAIKDKK